MKLILDTDDTVLYMKTLYETADQAAKYMEDTKLSEIRAKKPKLLAKDSAETKAKKAKAQATQNMADMLRVLMYEKPEEAIEIAKKFILLEDGEEYPSGSKMFDIVIKVFTDREVLDFFTLQSQLGQAILEG